jgi:hypothetical protein
MLLYQEITTKSYQILDLTSLTVDEFEQLVPPFEEAFVRHMRECSGTKDLALLQVA